MKIIIIIKDFAITYLLLNYNDGQSAYAAVFAAQIVENTISNINNLS